MLLLLSSVQFQLVTTPHHTWLFQSYHENGLKLNKTYFVDGKNTFQ